HARIAPLEPQDALSRARELDEAVGDVALLGGRTAAALAREFEPRLRPRERKHAAIPARAVHDDVGLWKASARVKRQQPRISRSGAGEPNMTWREHWGIGAHGDGCALFGHRMCPRSRLLTAFLLPESDGDSSDRKVRCRGNLPRPMHDRSG